MTTSAKSPNITLSIKQLSKTYVDAGETRHILNNVTCQLKKGESISIQGNSGSGKSSLLHIIGALDKPDSGEILFFSTFGNTDSSQKNIASFSERQADLYRRSEIGIIFQQYNLIDCISVLENIMLPAKLNAQRSPSKDVNHHYIEDLIHTLGIERHKGKLPHQLSGGEQQRVAIARALSHQPQLILADEPTGNLDSQNAQKVGQLLIDTCRRFHTSLLVVTHSADLAAQTDKQAILTKGSLVFANATKNLAKASPSA